MDWAKCKIEQNDSDDAISNAIREKLKDEKGISYTEIAQAYFFLYDQIKIPLMSF